MFRSAKLAGLLVAAVLWTCSTNNAEACGNAGCCCPPPPVHTTLCVAPPCSCCSKTVSVCIPGCCTGEPTVCWRQGLLGRQIGTYTWANCGHSVKVVVTRRGDVRVRG